ncbi:hypothetical protein [Bacteriovorax stolpii]|uniref:hypothetical protein n=1 Tax=Bacteriovorax stolpii TaxID=960 RepID=UPI001C8E176F|nr:hypothetical protein [Bacteriovorax stolpii]
MNFVEISKRDNPAGFRSKETIKASDCLKVSPLSFKRKDDFHKLLKLGVNNVFGRSMRFFEIDILLARARKARLMQFKIKFPAKNGAIKLSE